MWMGCIFKHICSFCVLFFLLKVLKRLGNCHVDGIRDPIPLETESSYIGTSRHWTFAREVHQLYQLFCILQGFSLLIPGCVSSRNDVGPRQRSWNHPKTDGRQEQLLQLCCHDRAAAEMSGDMQSAAQGCEKTLQLLQAAPVHSCASSSDPSLRSRSSPFRSF